MTDFFDLPQPKLTTGNVVRAFRRNFGFTLSDINQLTGAGETDLSAIENDKRPLGADLALRLAAIFGIDPGLLLFPNGTAILDRPDLRKVHRDAEALRNRKEKGSPLKLRGKLRIGYDAKKTPKRKRVS